MGEPAMERNEGTLAATLVTVPVPGAEGVAQVGAPETIVRTWPLLPKLPRPVPPDV